MKKLLWLMQIKVFLFVLTFSMNAAAKIIEVQVSDFAFNPSVLSNVEVGDTVRWIWVNGSHTTTSTSVPSGAATWDSPINSTSPSFDYPVLKVGLYEYKCTPHFLMGMVGSFTASFPSGINDKLSNAEILLFPNPIRDRLTIQCTSQEAPLRSLNIFDMSGRKLKEIYFENTALASENTISLDDLVQGVFFLQFRDSDGRIVVRKAVKQ